MNIKRPLLIIIPILLLFLLIFFICSDRGSLFKNDNSISSISDSDGIGYMREITPGEDMEETAGDNIIPGSTAEMTEAESPERRSSTADNKETYSTSNKNNDVSVKPSAERSIIRQKKEPVPEKNRVPVTDTSARKDDNSVKGNRSVDDSTAEGISEEKADTAEKVSVEENSDTDVRSNDDNSTVAVKRDIAEKDGAEDKSGRSEDGVNEDSSAADKSKNATADNKGETVKVVTDQSGSSKVKYNRVDRVYLYTGEIITGSVTARGQVYTIVTSDGIRKIAARDIQSNDIVK